MPLKEWALGKEKKMKELTRYVLLRGSVLTLEQGWGLQMAISFNRPPRIKPQDEKKKIPLWKSRPCSIFEEAELMDLLKERSNQQMPIFSKSNSKKKVDSKSIGQRSTIMSEVHAEMLKKLTLGKEEKIKKLTRFRLVNANFLFKMLPLIKSSLKWCKKMLESEEMTLKEWALGKEAKLKELTWLGLANGNFF